MTADELEKARKAIKDMAKSKRKTVDEVRSEMKKAIAAAYDRSNPAWKDFPSGPPEPEELIIYVRDQINKNPSGS